MCGSHDKSSDVKLKSAGKRQVEMSKPRSQLKNSQTPVKITIVTQWMETSRGTGLILYQTGPVLHQTFAIYLCVILCDYLDLFISHVVYSMLN